MAGERPKLFDLPVRLVQVSHCTGSEHGYRQCRQLLDQVAWVVTDDYKIRVQCRDRFDIGLIRIEFFE